MSQVLFRAAMLTGGDLPFSCHLRTVTPRSPSDYRDPQCAVISPSTPHSFFILKKRVSEEKKGTRAGPSVRRALSRGACFSRVATFEPGYDQTDESNAYPSRPRDGLRISSMVQRRRDPWRHRELNPRPHIRAAEYHRRDAAVAVRFAIWVLLTRLSPILTLRVYRWCSLVPECFPSPLEFRIHMNNRNNNE